MHRLEFVLENETQNSLWDSVNPQTQMFYDEQVDSLTITLKPFSIIKDEQ